MNEKDIDEVHNSFFELSSNLILSGVDPLIVAGSMTAGGMQLYKQILTEDAFAQMQKTIGSKNV